MKRFKNILVVFNDIIGDDDTLTQAAALAKRNTARLTIVEFFKDETLPPSFLAEREKHLHRLIESIHEEGIKVATRVLTGVAFLEIIRLVLSKKYDLVMMTAEGEEGYKSLFFGSTSLRLIRKCPCPVWLTNPGAKNDYMRILAAVGPNPDDIGENELNIKIMDLATSLADLNKSELHIAHAWDVTGNDSDTLRSETTEDLRSEIYHTHESAHKESLDRLLAQYDLKNIKHKLHLLRGEPEYVIPELADKIKTDLIVMGTIRHAWAPGFIIGTTAELILRQVNCAILAIKPEGFVTPVTFE